MNKISKILLFIIGGLIFSNIAYGVVTQTFVNPIPDANISSSANWNAKITTSSISETVLGIDYNNATGVFSLTSGYVGLVSSASSSAWNAKQDAMSAGTGINLVGAQINNSGVLSISSANTLLNVSNSTGTITLTPTSTPAFTKVIYPDTSVQISGYKPIAGASIIAPSSTINTAVVIGRPYVTSTAIEAGCQTTGSNITVNFKDDGVAFATTTATQAGNTSSSLSQVITNRKNITISVLTTSLYDSTSTLSCWVYGTQ